MSRNSPLNTSSKHSTAIMPVNARHPIQLRRTSSVRRKAHMRMPKRMSSVRIEEEIKGWEPEREGNDGEEVWLQCLDEGSGSFYYYNETTEETKWEEPSSGFKHYQQSEVQNETDFKQGEEVEDEVKEEEVKEEEKRIQFQQDPYIQKQTTKPKITARRRARTHSASQARHIEEVRLAKVAQEEELTRQLEEEKKMGEEMERLEIEKRHKEQEAMRKYRVQRQKEIDELIRKEEETRKEEAERVWREKERVRIEKEKKEEEERKANHEATQEIIDAEESTIETLLHLCSIGQWDTISWRWKALSSHEFKEMNERKMAPLHLALDTNAPFELCEKLYEACPEVVRCRTLENQMALHLLMLRTEASSSASDEEAGKALELVKIMVEAFEEAIEIQDDEGVTPFLIASERCHDSILRYLLKKHAHGVAIPDSLHNYPLHLYVKRPDAVMDIVEAIAREEKFVITAKDDDSKTCLDLVSPSSDAWKALLCASETFLTVAAKSHWDVIPELMGKDSFKSEDLLEVDAAFQTALHHAIKLGAPLKITKQLFEGCPSSVIVADRDGKTPLHWLLKTHLPEDALSSLINGFIDADPSILHMKDYHGNLPIHTACKYSQTFAILFILDRDNSVAISTNADLSYPTNLLSARIAMNDEDPWLSQCLTDVQKIEDELTSENQKFFKEFLQAIREGREALESKEKCLEMSRSATEKVKSASEEEMEPAKVELTIAEIAVQQWDDAICKCIDVIEDWANDLIESAFPDTCGTPWCSDVCSVGTCAKCRKPVTSEICLPVEEEVVHNSENQGLQCQNRGHHICFDCILGDGKLKDFGVEEEYFDLVRQQVLEVKNRDISSNPI
ncbi:hypothetical protein TrLO_g5829 [Triparma laevis f. longispina]|uniref:WW domain-containing protein n=1 Tax=Triparma laevis f. longispina TaxID=1714387 RepID=A0A9W6ZGE0_9STRA|nr:hypothetical protein TrLO_g5829 [Triparma laevis f. longispina]